MPTLQMAAKRALLGLPNGDLHTQHPCSWLGDTQQDTLRMTGRAD